MSEVTGVAVCNSDIGNVVYTGTANLDIFTNEQYDYTGVTKLTYYFNTSSTVSIDSSFDFSAFVFRYKSQNESIDIDRVADVSTGKDSDFTVDASNYQYTIGDVNDDGMITTSDASCIMEIFTLCDSMDLSSKVEDVNNYINTDKTINNDSTWSSRFNYLIRENTACCEVANVFDNEEGDCIIDQNDADEVLEYYSYVGSNIPTDDFIIGTYGTKLVLVSTSV